MRRVRPRRGGRRRSHALWAALAVLLWCSPALAAQRVVEMVLSGKVVTQQQTEISLQADTVCIHGDEPQAAVLAQSIRKRLGQAGIAVRAMGKASLEMPISTL